MRPSRLSEYLLRQGGEDHDPRKSQNGKDMTTRSTYYENQLEGSIALR